MTPTVKKEIHVWRRNSDAVVTDVEVVGTFYVQVKHKMLPLVITDIRPLTRDELTACACLRGRARIRAKSSSGTRARVDKLT